MIRPKEEVSGWLCVAVLAGSAGSGLGSPSLSSPISLSESPTSMSGRPANALSPDFLMCIRL